MKKRNTYYTKFPEIDEAPIRQWLGGRSFADCFAEFDEQGYLVFERVISPEQVADVRAALDPHLTKKGRNDFEGFKSNRVYALIAKAPKVFSDMITHPLPLTFAEHELGKSCLISALLAINLHPGETVQDWHYDDVHIDVPLPHPPFGVSTFWAIDDMTEENGATEVIPKSHVWTEAERIPPLPASVINDPRPRDVNEDPKPRDDAVKVIMPSGSLMIAKGTLWHRGGANKSDKPRLNVTPQYCPGWARQLENMVLATPPEIAAALPERTRALLGYSIHGTFMGYVDGVNPDRKLVARAAE